LGANAFEVLRYFVEGVVPTDTFPTAGSPANGMPETIFVVMKILKGDGLRADVAATERIVFVATDV
jgi:hypothetical protein